MVRLQNGVGSFGRSSVAFAVLQACASARLCPRFVQFTAYLFGGPSLICLRAARSSDTMVIPSLAMFDLDSPSRRCFPLSRPVVSNVSHSISFVFPIQLRAS